MISFNKSTLVTYAFSSVNLWGVISTGYGMNSFLAPAWFAATFWLLCALGVLLVCVVLPVATASRKEGKNMVRNFGTKLHSKVLWSYPFLVFGAVFLQYGEYLQASVMGLSWLVTSMLYNIHRNVIMDDIRSNATKGNVE